MVGIVNVLVEMGIYLLEIIVFIRVFLIKDV